MHVRAHNLLRENMCMHSPTGLSHPLASTIAAAVAIGALALTLGACSEAAPTPGDSACVLGPVDGDLVRQGDTVILLDARWNGWHEERLTLSLPSRWTIRPVDDTDMGVFDANGSERARTGTRAKFEAVTNPDQPLPLVIDGALVVCPE